MGPLIGFSFAQSLRKLWRCVQLCVRVWVGGFGLSYGWLNLQCICCHFAFIFTINAIFIGICVDLIELQSLTHWQLAFHFIMCGRVLCVCYVCVFCAVSSIELCGLAVTLRHIINTDCNCQKSRLLRKQLIRANERDVTRENLRIG